MRNWRIRKDSRVRFVLIIPILLLAAAPALAESACLEPPVPVRLKAGTVSADQMRAALKEANTFIAQSSVYQDCLLKEVEAAKTQAAAAGQPFEPMLETSVRYKIEASKKAQERVGGAANAALTAYKNH